MLQGSTQTNNFVSIPLYSDIKSAKIDRFFPFYINEGKAEIKLFNGSGDITASQNTVGIALLPRNKILNTGDHISCLFY